MSKAWKAYRKTIQPRPEVDEKAWPVYAAFTAFMAYFAGASYLLFDLDHPKWYYNAGVYIVLAALIWMVGLATIPLLDRSSLRRGVQFSLFLSLIVHLSMFLGMVVIDVSDPSQTALNENEPDIPKRREVVVPDYSPAQIDQVEDSPRDFEEPVETRDAEAEVEELQQEQIEHEQLELKQREFQEQLPREIEVEQIEKQQREIAQPREATLEELQSELNRQRVEMQQQQAQAIESPQVEQVQEQKPQLQAAQTQAQQQRDISDPQRRSASLPSYAQRQVELRRQQASEQAIQVASNAASSIRRQQLDPQLPRAQADLAAPAAPRSALPTSSAAPSTEVARRQNVLPERSISSRAPQVTQPRTTMAAAQDVSRTQRPADAQISPAAPSNPLTRSSSSLAGLPRLTSSFADQPLPRPNVGQTNRSQLQPASSSVTRQQVGGDGVAANAVNPGQLWAAPATDSGASRMVEQHGATRSTGSRNDGIVASDLRNPSIGRTTSRGGPSLAGAATQIEFAGPGGTNTGAMSGNASGLTAGELQSPAMALERGDSPAQSGTSGPAPSGLALTGPANRGSASVASDLAGLSRSGDRPSDDRPLFSGNFSGPSAAPGRSNRADGPSLSTRAQMDGLAADGLGPAVGGAVSTDIAGMDGTPGLTRRSFGGPDLPGTRPGTGDLASSGRDIIPAAGGLTRRRTADVGLPTTLGGQAALPARSTARTGPLLNTKAAVPTDAFSRRAMRKGRGSGQGLQPSKRTEEAIERGLEFLARHQSPDGRWSLRGFASVQPQNIELYQDELSSLNSDTAATGLALLAFLGAAYDHLSDKYQKQVQGGLEFLVRNQKPNGDLYISMDRTSNESCHLYSHAIAALALCEAYGMTQDARLRQPAQKSLDFIMASQDPQLGGWRYTPGVGTDTSVTGWMLLALKSGQLSGLDVDPAAFEGIRTWLAAAETRQSGRAVYVYNPYAKDEPGKQRGHQRQPSRTMTAVGALIQLYLGNRRDSQLLKDSAEYLKENLPTYGSPNDQQRDTYYWYYATQVMFHMRGEYWEAWDNHLHVLLEDTQVTEGPAAGSWDPKGEIPDRWGGFAGRIYVTTMNLLSLEVYYRHLPLYDDAAK